MLNQILNDSKLNFQKNVARQTAIRIILPGFFFAFASLAFFILTALQKKEDENGYYFFMYISVLFIIISIKFMVLLLKKQKVYLMKKNKKIKYYYITIKQYKDFIQRFDAQLTVKKQ